MAVNSSLVNYLKEVRGIGSRYSDEIEKEGLRILILIKDSEGSGKRFSFGGPVKRRPAGQHSISRSKIMPLVDRLVKFDPETRAVLPLVDRAAFRSKFKTNAACVRAIAYLCLLVNQHYTGETSLPLKKIKAALEAFNVDTNNYTTHLKNRSGLRVIDAGGPGKSVVFNQTRTPFAHLRKHLKSFYKD